MSDATATAAAAPEARSDEDRLAEIELRWGQYRTDYAEDVAANALDMLPIKRVCDEVAFLVERAKERGNAAGKAAERLRDIDREFREMRTMCMKDINADKRVPMACGKVVRTVEFLLAVAKRQEPPAEPLYVAEPAGPAVPARAGGVVVGARWTSGN